MMSVTLFFTALFATLIFIKALFPFAIKIGLTDRPCHRKQHKSPTPLIGGLAIFLAIGTTLLTNDLAFPHRLAYLLAAGLLVGVGLVDDYKGLGVRIRMVAQLAAGLVMTEHADIKITHLGDLFFLGNVELGAFSTAFTLFAVVGGINAFNMIDGIDGLAGSMTLVSIASLAIIALLGQDHAMLNFCLIIVAGLLVFLSFNLRVLKRSNASIFLGDTGSTFLGYTICWLAIGASQRAVPLIAPTTVLWIIAIPLFDSVCIMLRRISRKRSPFAPDREHLHHIMSMTGYTVNQVVKRLSSYAMIMASIGIIADLWLGIPAILMLLGFIALFIAHHWGMNYAWIILKTTRYLRTRRKITEDGRRKQERRVDVAAVGLEQEQRSEPNRRSPEERRFIPSDQQLESFYTHEERMENPDHKPTLKDKISIFWLNLYMGSK